MEQNDDRTLKMKQDIASTLNMDPKLLIYGFKKNKDNQVTLELTTISSNPHKTKFLFHATTAATPEAALKDMFEYVSKHMKEQDTYQIRWHNPNSKSIEVSWFRASNIMEALSKFFHDGKEVAEYKIYEVSLRPYA
jgi:hypothetical protein